MSAVTTTGGHGGTGRRGGSGPEHGGLLRTAARQGTIQLVGVVWSGVASFLLVVVLTTGLGATGYGAFAAAMALFTILMNAGKLGADVGLLREVPRLRAQGTVGSVRRVLVGGLVPVVLVGVLAGVLTWVWAGPLADLFVGGTEGLAQTEVSIRAMAPFVPVGAAMMVALVATRGFGSSTFSALVQSIAVPTVRPLLVLGVLAAVGGSLTLSQGVALAWAVPLAGGLVASVVYLTRASRRLVAAERATGGVPARAERPLADFWRFTGTRGVAGVVEAVVAWTGVLFVSALSGAQDAGIYSAVMRYIVLGTFALQAVRVAIGPQISSLVAESRTREAETVLQTMTTWLVALAWPFYLVLAVFGSTLLDVFGGDFDAGALALALLAGSQLVNMATGNVTLVLLMSGRSGWNLFNVLSSLALSVVLSLLLIPDHGVTGAAIAWGSAVVLENLLAAVEVRWLLGIRATSTPWFLVMGLALGCYGVLLLGVRLAAGPGVGALVGGLLGVSVVYGALLYRGRARFGLDEAWRALRRRKVAGA